MYPLVSPQERGCRTKSSICFLIAALAVLFAIKGESLAVVLFGFVFFALISFPLLVPVGEKYVQLATQV